jgi:hypothetical protein
MQAITSKQEKTRAESPYDEVNSLMALTIYHEKAVNHSGGKSLKYYLKKKSDREYEAAETEDNKMMLEMNRTVKFIESKLKSRYADNRMTSIQVYFNDNQGGSIPEAIPNPMLCKLNVLPNDGFETVINEAIINTQQGKAFVEEIMESWKWHIQRSRK